MRRLKGFSRLLSVLLAVALACAPVLPSLAMTVKTGEAHAVHAVHGDNHAGAPDTASTDASPCTQHESCNGQCCDFCAQCFSAVSPIALQQDHPHPVQTPVLTQLHSRLFSASPDRPPRLLSR